MGVQWEYLVFPALKKQLAVGRYVWTFRLQVGTKTIYVRLIALEARV
jgi:hypothetical protein